MITRIPAPTRPHIALAGGTRPVLSPQGIRGRQGEQGPAGAPGDESSYKALARQPDLIITGAITRNSNGAATSANVEWPDGMTGVYTALVLSGTFPGAVDSFSVTRVVGPTTTTYTQPTVTRDASGAVTNAPEIVVT